jgi:predicted helicase
MEPRSKSDLKRKRYAEFKSAKIRRSLFRPFTLKYYFFDPILSQDIVLQPKFFPTPSSELENIVIIVGGYGRKNFAVLASNYIPNYNFYGDPAQCFPYYTYAEDGSNRRNNITSWALERFQTQYNDEEITEQDIFHYVFAILHHPQYRERYVENLKHEWPNIALVYRKDTFQTCVHIGQQLMDLHLKYEQAKEYKLEWLEKEGVPFSWRVEKMSLSTDRRVVVVNDSLRLGPLPQECFEYRLGNRSALEWVIDQYQVRKDPRSGIESDPNQLDDEEYIVRLVGKVVTVSVETVKLVNELAQVVKVEDWMNVIVEPNEVTSL